MEVGRQFTTRAVLFLVAAAAILFAVGRRYGITATLSGSFVIFSLAIPIILRGRARAAFLIAWLATYGPFVAITLYTWRYVACDHCKRAAWEMLPYGPGMIPVLYTSHLLNIPRDFELALFALCFVVSMAAVALLAWLLRARPRWWGIAGAVIAIPWCSFSAFALLASIRA